MTETAKTAKEISRLDRWKSDARVYELSESVPCDGNNGKDNDGGETKFVIVSALNCCYSGPETYIFPAHFVKEEDKYKAINMLEMEGSFRGELNHSQALENIGFSV